MTYLGGVAIIWLMTQWLRVMIYYLFYDHTMICLYKATGTSLFDDSAIHYNAISSNEHIHPPKKLLTEWEVGCFANSVRPPGTVVPDGLMFYPWCIIFSFFFRHASSELSRPIAMKLCHTIGIWLCFIIPLQKFGGAPPKKFGVQNMQNFGQFWTSSDFDREYLRNGWRYPKLAGVTNYGNSSCV